MDKKLARAALMDGGIKVNLKDIQNVEILNVTQIPHIEDGQTITADHRRIVVITMADGTIYKVMRETVDKEGNFSPVSMMWKTKEVRKEG